MQPTATFLSSIDQIDPLKDFSYGIKPQIKIIYAKKLLKHRIKLREDLAKRGK